MSNTLIPENTIGKQVDLAEDKTFESVQAATRAFETAKSRLLDPGKWQQLSGSASASFEIIGKDLQAVSRSLVQGDRIRINIPGPGPKSGDGYDWVHVSLVESSKTTDGYRTGIKLVPSEPPDSTQEKPAHFFGEDSSSTLIIEQKGEKLISSYHGRNETANNKTESTADNVRNTLVAAGALAGLSELQWKLLINGLLK